MGGGEGGGGGGGEAIRALVQTYSADTMSVTFMVGYS